MRGGGRECSPLFLMAEKLSRQIGHFRTGEGGLLGFMAWQLEHILEELEEVVVEVAVEVAVEEEELLDLDISLPSRPRSNESVHRSRRDCPCCGHSCDHLLAVHLAVFAEATFVVVAFGRGRLAPGAALWLSCGCLLS